MEKTEKTPRNMVSIILAVGIVFVAIALAIILPLVLTEYKGSGQQNTVSSTGQSTMESMSDQIAVSVKVETSAKNAEDAQKENREISSAVMAALKKYAEEKDIETESHSMYEWIEWENNKNKFMGYKVNNVLKVTISDPEKAGQMIDDAVKAGALINYVNFELSKEKEKSLKEEALRKAAEDAKTKATSIADGLGVRLGKIVSVSESNFYYPRMGYATAEMAKGMDSSAEVPAPPTDLSPRKLEVSASVTVAYSIK